jgi:signal transduction histidine kinase
VKRHQLHQLRCLLRWPRTLFVRLTLIIFTGLIAAQGLSFWLTMSERNGAATSFMVENIGREVASSVAFFDRLRPAERAEWLPQLARHNYGFILGPGVGGAPPSAELSRAITTSIEQSIGSRYPVSVNAVAGDREHLQIHMQLSDGAPLTVDLRPMGRFPLSRWLPLLLLAQLALLAGCCWVAVRLATRPLNALARAADTLGPDLRFTHLSEDGPAEVAKAARAFNAMQERIGVYMKERIQILAAISHDLQTPITRMRIRADLMDDESERLKMQHDLKQMESLVREGVAYARTLHGATEVPRRVDPDAFIESLISDYSDAGDTVSLTGRVGRPLLVRPLALRRVLGNLIDNAIKFSGSCEVRVEAPEGQHISIVVLDRGPGIPDEQLDAVFQPFYRVESSRNRGTGGTGLGLSIAKQLAMAMNATLTLRNRNGGGLEARLTLESVSDGSQPAERT